MPPRYAYWTIIVDNQPTAFRAGAKEDLLPTFNRLKGKNASATMMWFQNGKLWPSRLDAQEAMLARGEMGRRGDERQAGFPAGARSAKVGGFRDRERKPASRSEKPEWKPKGEFTPAPKRSEKPEWKSRSGKPEWKPKGEFTSASKRSEKPDWKPKSRSSSSSEGGRRSHDKPRSFARPEWKPSGDDTRSAKPEWKPKGSFTRERKPDWKSKPASPQARKPLDRKNPTGSRKALSLASANLTGSPRPGTQDPGPRDPKNSTGNQEPNPEPVTRNPEPRNGNGCPRRNTRNPWGSKRSVTTSGVPAASIAIRVRSTRTRRKRSGPSSRRRFERSGNPKRRNPEIADLQLISSLQSEI